MNVCLLALSAKQEVIKSFEVDFACFPSLIVIWLFMIYIKHALVNISIKSCWLLNPVSA